MYKICRTEQASRRQRELERGLLQMLQTHRYEDISVISLCNHLQIPRRAFYRYFTNKDGALYALLDHTLGDYFDTTYPTTLVKTTPMNDIQLFFDFWYQHKALLDTLENSGLIGILVERANALAQQELTFPQMLPAVPQHLQPMALSFTVCGLMAMVLSWHRAGFPLSPREMAEVAITLLEKPLLASL